MTTHNQFLLLKTRRFLPLFITQFLGAFHDNVFKNAFVVLLLFDAASRAQNPELLTSLAAGIFILPYVLFSALGGQLADKFDKKTVINAIKMAEILIALFGTASIFTGNLYLSYFTLFMLGTHSAFFSPSKYSILPDHLHSHELIGGNALVNTGTFLAILFGTLAGTLLITLPDGKLIISGILILSAAIGYLTSLSIPAAPPKAPDIILNPVPVTETVSILRQTFNQPLRVVRCIIGISWFYFMGGMFMAQLPNYTKLILSADEHVLSFFLMLFSVGIAAGGLLNNRLLKGRIEGVYVPLAMLGLTAFSFDLFLTGTETIINPRLVTLAEFLSTAHNWRIVFDVTMIAICGGIYVVPLNAIVQHMTPEAIRSRILAGSAIMDAIFIVLSSVACIALIASGLTISQIFLVFALCNAMVAIYICGILPEYLFKSFLQILFKILYRVEVRGFENFEKAGDRAVIIGNHVSLLDPPLLAAFIPGRPMFAINKFVAEWWWVRPFLRLVEAFPLDPTNPFSLKDMIRKVEDDRHLVIFPEGRLTDTGALMKVYDGPGMIADKAQAVILPVRLDGVQHTPFARLKGKIPLKSFPKITITILPPVKLDIDPSIKGRDRRSAAGKKIYDIMEGMMFMTGDREQTLYEALLKARYVNGDDAIIAEDVSFKPLKFRKLIQGSIGLGRQIERITTKRENVGVMLPNSTGAIVTFFALQAFGRVPAMMNYSTGAKAMISACTTAQIKTVITSRKFIEMGRLEELNEKLAAHVNVVYAEDLRKKINFIDILFSNPARIHQKQDINPTDPAVVLFTSGSEGEPKGVALSHINLMTNIVQLASRVDFNRQDLVFNCLPVFHSFGLTGGTLLPILSGIRTFFYPSPLHYRIVPEMVYNTNATIMFGTDTFLQGYARKANPYDFYRMRYIFAGAEKVKDETRRTYMNKFGVRIFEGYGATETAPVIAVNSAMHNRDGTVGRFLPGIEYRLEAVPGITEGGRLYVRGPNVMLGYYKPDNPGVLQPPEEGWHDTGDIVSVDGDGFVKIMGRAKRFAKIAGEMVSLTMVEAIVHSIWPNEFHAVISVPDARKGEQLVLVTTEKDAHRNRISEYAASNHITGLAVPAVILNVDAIPVLGSGKTDYPAVLKIVNEKINQTA